MALTQADMETIGATVQTAVENALQSAGACCPLKPVSGHFAGLLEDTGNGDPNAGLRNIRADLAWVREVRAKTDRYGSSVFLATIGLLTVTVVGGMLALVSNWIRGG